MDSVPAMLDVQKLALVAIAVIVISVQTPQPVFGTTRDLTSAAQDDSLCRPRQANAHLPRVHSLVH